MSVMMLVRHGQASFFADDYDQLSTIGAQQASQLGTYWSQQGLRIDQVYTGPRNRQRRTAKLAGDAYHHSGLPWPEPTVLDALDEYDLVGLSQQLAPALALRDSAFAELTQSYLHSRGSPEQAGSFQRMFQVLLRHWQSLPPESTDFESWPVFRARVETAIRRIQESSGSGSRVAVITSGGVIGAIARWAMGASDYTALELNWRVRNCSQTDFVFTQDRFTLDTFNTVPHLPDSSLWTYR